jgi:predicted molibdopterin-dependent oxidoreductase YjgC
MTVNITVNGQKIAALEGQTILEVSRQQGIRIPVLCYHKDLSPTGNCRMCVVDIKGGRFLQSACTTPVGEGMVIETDNERVRSNRKQILEFMLANHPQDCITCDAGGSCELQDLAYEYQVTVPGWGTKGTRYLADSDPNPFIRIDMNRCILCRRCVLACAEIQVRDVWGVAKRGMEEVVVTGADTTMLEARCESCGQCVAYCPTGALSNKMMHGMARSHQARTVTTTCTYCGVGCQFDLWVKDNRILGVASNPDAPVNGMALCVKGRYGYDFIHHPDRLKKPMVRRYLLERKEKVIQRSDQAMKEWVEVDWDTALEITAEKLYGTSLLHGADTLGVLTSAKCTNEENYLMNKLARQVLGTNNIDHCARL